MAGSPVQGRRPIEIPAVTTHGNSQARSSPIGALGMTIAWYEPSRLPISQQVLDRLQKGHGSGYCHGWYPFTQQGADRQKRVFIGE